jgi:hypothetical protein
MGPRSGMTAFQNFESIPDRGTNFIPFQRAKVLQYLKSS